MSTSTAAMRNEQFALYQVRLRAEEIDFVSRETYNADLQKLINKSYSKLNNDFELQRNEITRNAKISYSVSKNEQRINILKCQEEIIEEAMNGARKKLKEFRQKSEYKDVLCDLIKQGLKTLNEKKSVIRVVKEDIPLANECLDKLSELGFDASVSDDDVLSDSLIGGAIITNDTRTISCDNSFEGRLQLAEAGRLPQIAKLLKSK
ncbi:vacuolar H+-ATPase subunit E isoform 3 [Histomonas meleagridis]|uniref:vacuolar H+-ATPase subunit E isoform 3 n=1 Tax=Histomonas meleagridis TaxID=135588 RepID=UPI00355A332D|nr:vacuolar H+-ATPase subunit E isoform 3 [Histomonas meleagridis]KAH0796622.1 vacuolar H+-ATPase subunit E isoform 3 [Histomonas meleagridis]